MNKFFEKLSLDALDAFVGASELASLKSHKYVTIFHWISSILEKRNPLVDNLLTKAGIKAIDLQELITKILDTQNSQTSSKPYIADDLIKMMPACWSLAASEANDSCIESWHVVVAAARDTHVRATLQADGTGFERLTLDLALSVLRTNKADASPAQAPAHSGLDSAHSVGEALRRYTIDLTLLASQGRIDPVVGREAEVARIVDILLRRRQNNPILVGDPGVGKTAVVEGFATLMQSGKVPPSLAGARLLSLDLAALRAGASARGEFEARLKGVVDAVKAAPQPIILFIDEAHTLVGDGQSDAANILKPALARGELRTIAATTWAEYKKYFERDAALTRRFQVVAVPEPDDATAIAMVAGIVEPLERHHGVIIERSAVEDAVRLSRRFLPDRQLPDKAISLLDTACARVALGRYSEPASLTEIRARIQKLEIERHQTALEARLGGGNVAVQLEGIEAAIKDAGSEIEATTTELNAQRELVTAIQAACQSDVESDAASSVGSITNLRQALADRHESGALVHATVDRSIIATILSEWTGIPLGRVAGDALATLLDLEARLSERVVGQPGAVATVARALRIGRARLTDPRKPIGVFMFLGTSGVGKTETALALADLMYSGGRDLTIINMSEFKEEHKVSMLLGSPPGYVGYGEGGVLTEAVRRKPYSVILLDEMEKAHPGVQDVFYQVFDKGMLKDGEGREIDFKNTVIIMTSNAGTETLSRLHDDGQIPEDYDEICALVRPEALSWFKPAFLGRVTMIPYLPLGPETLAGIAQLKLQDLANRLHATHGAKLIWNDAIIQPLVAACTDPSAGARLIDQTIATHILPALAIGALTRSANGETSFQATLSSQPNGEILVEIA